MKRTKTSLKIHMRDAVDIPIYNRIHSGLPGETSFEPHFNDLF